MQTVPNGSGGALITINPENSNLSSSYASYGDSILNYGVFHELGHDLDLDNALSLYNSPYSEGYANTAGRAIENDLHIPLAAFPGATPPGGYK
jgi:hypothetical protein